MPGPSGLRTLRVFRSRRTVTGESRISDEDVVAATDPIVFLRQTIHSAITEIMSRIATRDAAFDAEGERRKVAFLIEEAAAPGPPPQIRRRRRPLFRSLTSECARCSFRDASLKGPAIGTQVTECDFTGADLRSLRSLPNTRFEGCRFGATDLSGAAFSDTTFTDCTFADDAFSADMSFTRCAFVNTAMVVGLARVTRSRREGDPLPDQWDGAERADAAREAYGPRYARATDAGRADDLPWAAEAASKRLNG